MGDAPMYIYSYDYCVYKNLLILFLGVFSNSSSWILIALN